MRVLNNAIFVEAHTKNFNTYTRPTSSIKFIVIHYTGNINDTARNNALYFHSSVTHSSAHYFVSEKTVYQSVKDIYPAYSVGLGGRKEPYFKWPAMWKKITNSNSISIEICGSSTSREGTDQTKDTAAQLVADLLEKYDLPLSCIYRHYDVTGKRCPAWAVDDPMKWLEFKLKVSHYLSEKGEDDNMLDTQENYNVFKTFMDRYLTEIAQQPADWETEAMQYCEAKNLIHDGRPKSNITRGELATVLMRMNAEARLHK